MAYLPEIPADVTLEQLANIVGQLTKTIAWMESRDENRYLMHEQSSGDNLLRDHSFENLQTTGSADNYGTFAIDTSYLGNYYWWNVVGSPRVLSDYYTADPSPEAFFGYQAAVVNNTNYLWQQSGIPAIYAMLPFCFSVHAAPRGGNTAGAKLTCTLQIDAINGSGVVIGSSVRTFTVSENYSANDEGKWTRGYVVYKSLPAGTAYVKVSARSGSAEWILIDGAQLVPGERMLAYNPENQLWQHVRSVDGTAHYDLLANGTTTLQRVTAGGLLWAYLVPGAGGLNKLLLSAANGIEFNTLPDGTGTVMFSCNEQGKGYLQWLQLQSGASTPSPAPGALRYNPSYGLQFWDGSVWKIVATNGYSYS